MAGILDIEGIGPERAEKLKAIGVKTTDDLLSRAGTAKGRKEVAATTGLSEALILDWVNRADLFRIKGIGTQYSDLLEAAGVDTVVELARRNVAHLLQKLSEVNDQKHLVRALPSEGVVAGWIEQAKALPRMVEY